MKASIRDIASAIQSRSGVGADAEIAHLLTDSRQLAHPASTLFFAITAHRRDGHDFIEELYKGGVRNFVVSRPASGYTFEDANFLEVENTLQALQALAAWHRARFDIPVIGITGSNGKTVVKEWLFQLLQEDHPIARSPKSYNSQIGAALSLWEIDRHHEIAIIEAGISQPGEMERLEKMIRPTIGIFTAFGEAHSEGFSSDTEKISEKLKLFRNCRSAVFGRDASPPRFSIGKFLTDNYPGISMYDWSKRETARLTVKEIRRTQSETTIDAVEDGRHISISIPFTDDASIENAITCWVTLRMLGKEQDIIADRMRRLQPVSSRLELKKARNGCTLINDSYSADLSSLAIALDFMDQHHNELRKTVILSDFLQSSMPDEQLYGEVLARLRKHGITRLIAVGERLGTAIRKEKETGEMEIQVFPRTEDLLAQLRATMFRDEIILVKGARLFGFERIVQQLEQKTHQTILEINLNAIAHNLKQFQSRLRPGTKVMAMVKAFAYGSGGAEIAGILQYHKIDYLGVAYADEGVELRKAGIHTPVMVMNPEPVSFSSVVEHRLEPEIYSFRLLEQWEQFLQGQGISGYPVHIELETGMNRLGFATEDATRLASILAKGCSRAVSVFSHLAASEEEALDAFTKEQFDRFVSAADEMEKVLGYAPIRHIANSAAIIRHPYAQLDMVRLGIGLYGIEPSTHALDLETVATLRSTIAQVRELEPGASVSYNRRGKIERKSRIATIRIGYADGYPRSLGNGKGSVWVRGQLAPVTGTVCMDMIMVDVTGIPGVLEGDEVVLFGRGLPVQELAKWAHTIPYEIMTGISQRVKRVYFME